MKRLLVVCALIGCSPGPLPPPAVRAIAPSAVKASDSTDVVVDVSAVLPFEANYSVPDAGVDPRATLLVGSLAVGTGRFEDGGTLTGTVPSLLAPGDYDVTVVLSDGRQGTLSKGYHVDAGAWPTGYNLDNIAAQKSGKPFEITVHALGANGPAFHGNVLISAPFKSSVTPTLSQAFDAGTLVQTVTMGNPANGVVLVVTDNALNFGVSNSFDVTP
jgi:hypothetical protein